MIADRSKQLPGFRQLIRLGCQWLWQPMLGTSFATGRWW